MVRARRFLDADFSDQWQKSYSGLQAAEQKGIDRLVIALLKAETTPGMRIKPIEPEKYYFEVRANDGDRIVHRIEGGRVYFVDVVAHDRIGKYGKR